MGTITLRILLMIITILIVIINIIMIIIIIMIVIKPSQSQAKARQGKPRQDKARECKARQGKARQGNTIKGLELSRDSALSTDAQNKIDEIKSLLAIGQSSEAPRCWPTHDHVIRGVICFALPCLALHSLALPHR